MGTTATIIVSVISAIGLLGGSGGVLTILMKNRPSKAVKETDALASAKKDHESDRAAWRAEKEEWRLEREEWRAERAAFIAERQAWAEERKQWETERDQMEERHGKEVHALQGRVSRLEEELRGKTT